jgi:hypothetical protein
MDKIDLLDDNAFNGFINSKEIRPEDSTKVMLLAVFNHSEQAYFAAALLHEHNIPAQVVGTATAQLTPFSYGNFRLFIPTQHADQAKILLQKEDEMPEPLETKNETLVFGILMAVVGLVVLGMVVRAVRLGF